MSCRVSGLTLLASAFLMVSSACLITTGQLYAREAEATTRRRAAERIDATIDLMHRHSSLIRRSLSPRVEFFCRAASGPREASWRRLRSAREERRLRHAAAQPAGGQTLEDHPVLDGELITVGRRRADVRGCALELLQGPLALLLARRRRVEPLDAPPPRDRRRVILKDVEQGFGARRERRDREDLVDLRHQPDLVLARQAGNRCLH